MANFGNPFMGNIDRKISKEELLQSLKLDLAGELEAIFGYEAHAAATEDVFARKALLGIRDEEVKHVGELMTLIRYLDPNSAILMQDGQKEAADEMVGLGISRDKIRASVEANVAAQY